MTSDGERSQTGGSGQSLAERKPRGSLAFAIRLFVLNSTTLVVSHLLAFEVLTFADTIEPAALASRYLAAFYSALGIGVGVLASFLAGLLVGTKRAGLAINISFTVAFFVPGLVAAVLTLNVGIGAIAFFAGTVMLLPMLEAVFLWGPQAPGALLLIALHLGGLAVVYFVGTEVDFNVMDGADVRVFYVVVDVCLCSLWSIAPALRAPLPHRRRLGPA